VYLPNDVWYDFWTGERQVGGKSVLAETPLDRIPVYVRAGGILPLAPVRNSTQEPPGETLSLHVWPGPEGCLHWYEDDGISREHESGVFHQRLITLGRHGRTTHLHFGAAEGKFSSRIRNWKIVLWDTSPKARIRIDGAQRKSPVSPETELLVIDLPNRDSAIDISVVGGV
jgi:alpha-glucosidase (family GH31 glycosyl hydrolase)